MNKSSSCSCQYLPELPALPTAILFPYRKNICGNKPTKTFSFCPLRITSRLRQSSKPDWSIPVCPIVVDPILRGDPMATAASPTTQVKTARSPFLFNSASHLLRIGRERAHNLSELLEGLRICPDASIFQHMFQTLQEHHFIREGFSNDFSQWAFFACNETALAEQLSGVDAREFTSIRLMRQRI